MKILSKKKIYSQAAAYVKANPPSMGPGWGAEDAAARKEYELVRKAYDRHIIDKCNRTRYHQAFPDDFIGDQRCNCPSLPGYADLKAKLELATARTNMFNKELGDALRRVRDAYLTQAFRAQEAKKRWAKTSKK